MLKAEFTTGTFRKEIHGNELYLFNAKGELIFKRWINQNRSVVFDVATYGKDTLESIMEENGKIIIKKNVKN